MMNDMTRRPSLRPGWGLLSDFDHFDDFWRVHRPEGSLAPAVDVEETEDGFHIRADLPGVKKEDIDVSIQDGVLTINAEARKEEHEEKEGRLIRQERRYGKFVRSMRLGDSVDAENIKAAYKDGVLDLRLPKTERVKPRKIGIGVD